MIHNKQKQKHTNHVFHVYDIHIIFRPLAFCHSCMVWRSPRHTHKFTLLELIYGRFNSQSLALTNLMEVKCALVLLSMCYLQAHTKLAQLARHVDDLLVQAASMIPRLATITDPTTASSGKQ